ncbi:Aldo/keto reductase [Mycena olivaceomarginata]|nr:Aldo/keto reductase [Mycena olivaceomarginata]
MPSVGVGCWMGLEALKIGYRHIDTQLRYTFCCGSCNEEFVDLFIATKLDQCDHGRVSDALNESLAKLGKSPTPSESPTIGDTWRDMEKLLDSVPAINQVEMHPLLPQHSLLAFCRARGIILTAYSPVGKNKFSSDPDVVRIADAHGVTGPQVILSWGVQRGTSVIPKTSNHERLRENMTLIYLSVEEMLVLDRLHEKPGMHRSICGFHSSDLGGSALGGHMNSLAGAWLRAG